MRFLLSLFFLCASSYLYADSPLTSINYWKSVDDAYVLSIGNKPGKKKLTKKMISYFNNPDINTFNKLALINAIGWEFQSKVNNSEIYLKSIIKKHKKTYKLIVKSYKGIEDEFSREIIDEFFSKLKNDEYTLLYAYLEAMDNYTNDYFLDDLISYSDFKYNSFVYLLIEMQSAVLKMEYCKAWELFYDFTTECIYDKNILKSLPIFNKYLSNYQYSCSYLSKNVLRIELEKICNLNTFSIEKGLEIWVLNYPVFVYGNLILYDENNTVIENRIIDGDDYVLLNSADYKKGSYRAVLKNDKTLKEYIIEIIIE